MSRGSSRGSSRRSSSTTSPTPHVRVPQHVARLIMRLVAPLVVDYLAYVARPGASARRAARHMARHRLLHLRRASGCLGMSRGSSRGSSRCSSSTTSPTPRVLVPQHVARLVTRLVVDYFMYAARPVDSAHRAACRMTHHRLLRLPQARRRLLRLRRASGCLGTSCGSSRGSSSTTSPRAGSSSTTLPTPRVRVPRHVARLVTWLVIDYSTYAARSGGSACHAARRATRCRLLQLCRASECLGTSRGSSCGSLRRSSSTTSPMPRVRVPRHVTRLVVDYSVHRDFVLRPHWLYFSHTVRRDYLSCGNTGSTSSTPRAAATSSSGRITSTIHLD
jgi:hypothetical protein